MIHIVNVSGGAASAVALFRVIDRYGVENTRAVFADINSEDADVYRFIKDMERAAGIRIDRLNDGRNIWSVFHQAGFIKLKSGCKASYELKKKPLIEYYKSFGDPAAVVMNVGFGPDEDDRQRRLIEAAKPWRVDFPLCWKPRLFRCDVFEELKRRGIKRPSMYDAGYPHANCGGGCVLAGTKQWAGLLRDNPKLFAYHESEEAKFQNALRESGREEHTILRDRRGGSTKNYPLSRLRQDIENGIRPPDDSWRASSCSCVGNLFDRIEVVK